MAIKEVIKVKKRSRMKLSKVDGDLRIGKGATIVAKEGTIVVTGKIKNKGGFKCKGNLEALTLESEKGSVSISGYLKIQREIEVDKKLTVNGFLEAEEASAGLTVIAKKGARAEKISAGFRVYINNGEVESESISAGDSVHINAIGKIGKVKAGRRINIHKKCDINVLSAGAKVVINGGKFEAISAGMSIINKGVLEAEKLSAGMNIKLFKNSKAGHLSAGFSVRSKADLDFGKASAGFSVKIGGSGKGVTASAGFTVKSNGNLLMEEAISAGFSCIAKGDMNASRISAGRKIIAKTIKAIDIKVNRRGRLFADKVEAEEIVLEERAKAKNLFVKELEMREKSCATNVFAERIIIEDGARLKGKVEYSDSIDAEKGAKITKNATKV
ncbi:MAG: hypothetical protein FK734_10930 [Asgard group archaeon]|nr:hypothetical protein [Asgard group archaeon]